MNDKAGWIDNGVEGIRTGGVSQTTGDWVDKGTADLISNTAVGEG